MVQALEKNAKEFGIRRQQYRDDICLHTMFRMSKAIALLPPNMVPEGWEAVKRKANQSPNQDVASRYVRYFETHWIDRVGAANFTVYNSPRRTNNDQEVFHRLLNSYMGGNRPGIWHFTKTLLKLDKHFSEKFHVQQDRPILWPRRRVYVQLDRNLALAKEKFHVQQDRPILWPRRRVYVQLDRNLALAKEKLLQGRLSVEEFLAYTGHLAYDSERRRNNISYQIPQIPEHPVNVANDEGLNRQNNLQQMILEQQNRLTRQMAIQENANNILIDEPDFVLSEEGDPLFIAIAEI
uniref:Uncharacterized protein n=1 Tax=Schizaphis graminum TaxID=13262 RepID=A0A2S2NAR0_SCHGA